MLSQFIAPGSEHLPLLQWSRQIGIILPQEEGKMAFRLGLHFWLCSLQFTGKNALGSDGAGG